MPALSRLPVPVKHPVAVADLRQPLHRLAAHRIHEAFNLLNASIELDGHMHMLAAKEAADTRHDFLDFIEYGNERIFYPINIAMDRRRVGIRNDTRISAEIIKPAVDMTRADQHRFRNAVAP